LSKKSGHRREKQIQRENEPEPEVEALLVCVVVDHWIIVVVGSFVLSLSIYINRQQLALPVLVEISGTCYIMFQVLMCCCSVPVSGRK
jgi:biotin transporter BioY